MTEAETKKINATEMSIEKCLHESSSSLNPIIAGSDDQRSNKEKGHYAVNLAFCAENEAEAFLQPKEKSVYSELTQPLTPAKESTTSGTSEEQLPNQSTWLFWRAVLSGCLFAACIILIYLWVHVQHVNPMFVEVFQYSPPSTEMPRVEYMKMIEPVPINTINIKSEWNVEYDLPAELPLIKMNAEDMKDMIDIQCPPGKFALALHLESNSELAENWLKVCGPNVAYFRVDGNPSMVDVDRLVNYVENAEHLPLKATLRLEKGEDIVDNQDFQKTQQSDEVIRSVEISGFVNPKTIQELSEVVPFAEELTIRGSDICKTLKRSMRTSAQACHISWPHLSKLHILETQECKGMYDLIYSCWGMPRLETLQVRKSIISSPNADFIESILDSHRIMKVDFADNVCFDDTLQRFPFMCQASA